MGQRRSRDQWNRIVSAYAESGMTQAAFATSFGVPLSSLQYQLRRRRESDPYDHAEGGGFVEVPWTPAHGAASDSELSVEIRLGDTVTLRASAWPPATWLGEVLAVAGGRGC